MVLSISIRFVVWACYNQCHCTAVLSRPENFAKIVNYLHLCNMSNICFLYSAFLSSRIIWKQSVECSEFDLVRSRGFLSTMMKISEQILNNDEGPGKYSFPSWLQEWFFVFIMHARDYMMGLCSVYLLFLLLTRNRNCYRFSEACPHLRNSVIG